MKKFYRDLSDLVSQIPSLVLTLMVLSVVGMNLLANKSINTGLDWLALDCGFLLSWLTFLTMDIATHCFGPRAATAGSLVALVLNLFMALIFFLGSLLPGVWGESFVPGSEQVINQALDNTFGGTWFIILGSSVAFAVSSVLNNFLNWAIGKRLGERGEADGGFGRFALRSYVSTFVAQFVDNLLFALLVSRVFFGWALVQCITCALTGAVMELLFEVFFSPVGYRISRHLMGEAARRQGAGEVLRG